MPVTPPTESPTESSALRAIRKRQGKGFRSTARRIGVDPAHLSRIERGLALPSVPVLIRLSLELGVEPAELLAAIPAETAFHPPDDP